MLVLLAMAASSAAVYTSNMRLAQVLACCKALPCSDTQITLGSHEAAAEVQHSVLCKLGNISRHFNGSHQTSQQDHTDNKAIGICNLVHIPNLDVHRLSLDNRTKQFVSQSTHGIHVVTC